MKHFNIKKGCLIIKKDTQAKHFSIYEGSLTSIHIEVNTNDPNFESGFKVARANSSQTTA